LSEPAGLTGLRIGHATDAEARTGCTVLLGPFRGACFVAGHATGSRELDSLSALHLVPRIDALLFTGGSAFGLGAADGVVAWLEERGLGFDTRYAHVPIVPAAVIFDLGVGRADRRPGPRMGREACDAATPGLPAEGLVGAGTGASAGKLLGRENASRGGFGCWTEQQNGYTLVSVVVANPLGDVVDENGEVVAGARAPDGAWAYSERVVRSGQGNTFAARTPVTPGTNTTLAAIVTDAPLPKDALALIARMGAAALARRITPAFTPFDGDIVFALSTAMQPETPDPLQLLALGTASCAALEKAIVRAVTA
jgi:L-aminopeptidase/D-esterase-like protein